MQTIKNVMLLPFLPVIICKRIVCGKSNDTDESSNNTTALSLPSSLPSGKKKKRRTSSSSYPSFSTASSDHHHTSEDDLPLSRFQSVRGSAENKEDWAGLRHRGTSTANPRDDDVDRYRTVSDEFLDNENENNNDNDNDDDNNNDSEQGDQLAPLRSHSPTGSDTSDTSSRTSRTSRTSSGFSRERVESINRAQNFLGSNKRYGSNGHGSNNSANGELDRETMERLLLADRTHAWLKKLYFLFFVLWMGISILHLYDIHQKTKKPLWSDVLQTLKQVPDQTIVVYVVLSLSLWIFRNDFPFNLMILLICAFAAGRLTSTMRLP
jgi:hypothetical protein